jgi:hypothetical protein
MPIEIRELVIRAVVDETGHPAPTQAPGEEDRSKLIQKCVDEVLKALRRKRER